MNKIICFVIMFLIGLYAVSAAIYITNPLLAPNNYQSQTCTGINLVCGYNSGTTFCYNMSQLSPPSVNATSVTDIDSGSINGGYILDYTSYSGGSAPYCTNSGNYWCDRNSSCYNSPQNRYTVCLNGTWAQTSCGACTPGYNNCTGPVSSGCTIQTGVTSYPSEPNANYNSTCGPACNSGYLDCNGTLGLGGDGCEIHVGGACTISGLSGTYAGYCFGGVGVCVLPTQNFITTINALYATNSTQTMLWGTDYGTGILLNLTNNVTKKSFAINSTGCIIWQDGSVQCGASNSSSGSSGLTPNSNYLYNSTTYLYFNESVLNITVNNLVSANVTSLNGNISYINNNLTSLWSNMTSIYLNVSALWNNLSAANNAIISNISALNTSLINAINGNASLKVNLSSNWNNSGYNITASFLFASINASYIQNAPWGVGSGTVNDTWWNITGSNYLWNNSNVLYLNETKLNLTITALASAYNSTSLILTINTSLYGNLSVLNNNITAINGNISAINSNLTSLWNNLTSPANAITSNISALNTSLINAINGNISTLNTSVVNAINNNISTLNTSLINSIIGNSSLKVNLSSNWNNSGFNITASFLFASINASYIQNAPWGVGSGTNDTWWNITGSNYLWNNSNVLYLNETKLNATINALALAYNSTSLILTINTSLTGNLSLYYLLSNPQGYVNFSNLTAYNTTSQLNTLYANNSAVSTAIANNATVYNTAITGNATAINTAVNNAMSNNISMENTAIIANGTVLNVNITSILNNITGINSNLTSLWNNLTSPANAITSNISALNTSLINAINGNISTLNTSVVNAINNNISTLNTSLINSIIGNSSLKVNLSSNWNNSGFNITASFLFASINASYIQNAPWGVGSGTNDTWWNITGSNYLWNNSNVLYLNETKLNLTINNIISPYNISLWGNITAINSNLTASWSNISLLNINLTAVWSNITLINSNLTALWNNLTSPANAITANISALNTSLINAINGNISALNTSMVNAINNNISTLNTSLINSIIGNSSLKVNLSSNWNNSGFNITASFLFASINASYIQNAPWIISSITDTWWNITGSNYLWNNSNVLYLNETKLNTTITTIASQYNETNQIIALQNNITSNYYNKSNIDSKILWQNVSGTTTSQNNVNITANLNVQQNITMPATSTISIGAGCIFYNGTYLVIKGNCSS